MDNEKKMNKRVTLALFSSIGISAIWSKPIIKSVITPAHAETSCVMFNDVNIIGNWRFTDQNNISINITILDDNNIIFDNRGVNDPLIRALDGRLIFDIQSPRAGWQGNVTQEVNCIASEITITIAPTDENTFTPPLIGVRF